tara:strand:+ start:2702 stop:2965 length:264 start_codon:yes stop_codon:yes gene_type:complete
MTEYAETVERQRLLLEAEEWAKGINQIHVFDASTTNMWYEEHPEDGRVTDTTYNDGRIVRTQGDQTLRVYGNRLTGDDLIDKYSKLM